MLFNEKDGFELVFSLETLTFSFQTDSILSIM